LFVKQLQWTGFFRCRQVPLNKGLQATVRFHPVARHTGPVRDRWYISTLSWPRH